MTLCQPACDWLKTNLTKNAVQSATRFNNAVNNRKRIKCQTYPLISLSLRRSQVRGHGSSSSGVPRKFSRGHIFYEFQFLVQYKIIAL